MKRRVLVGFMGLGLLFFGNSCKKDSSTTPVADNLYVPVASDATASATLADLQSGRTFYAGKCGSCHGIYSPDSFSAARWKGIVADMAPKAGLSSADATLVYKYVSRGK
jgi:mono/diheme cytochrome c family protein